MQTRQLDLPLTGFGVPPSRARVEVAVLTPVERIRRSALGFAALLLVAVVALPIPLVHLVLVPAALLGAVALAAVRLRQGEVFRHVSGDCPFCGAQQTFTVLGRFRLPKTLYCEACHRELRLAD
jgi:hypothetical protein